MNKLKIVLISILFVGFIVPQNSVKADVNVVGGVGSNLIIKQGIVAANKESVSINLYSDSAEVEQDYFFQNKTKILQKVFFGFSYQKSSNNSISDIQILVDNTSIDLNSDQVSGENNQTHLITFPVNFTRGQIREIKISHKQLNSANFRGLRSFNYALKNKLKGPIGEFNLQINLMDNITLDNFNKTLNPDLNLTLEPIGWKQNGSTLDWTWKNFSPGFDILANFYLPNSDLARVTNLNQPMTIDASGIPAPIKPIIDTSLEVKNTPFWQQFLVNLWLIPVNFFKGII